MPEPDQRHFARHFGVGMIFLLIGALVLLGTAFGVYGRDAAAAGVGGLICTVLGAWSIHSGFVDDGGGGRISARKKSGHAPERSRSMLSSGAMSESSANRILRNVLMLPGALLVAVALSMAVEKNASVELVGWTGGAGVLLLAVGYALYKAALHVFSVEKVRKSPNPSQNQNQKKY